MSRLKIYDVDPVDVDADGISAAATPGAAGNLTLGGALASGGTYTAGDGDAARQISILAAADDSARTFTVTGTDAGGRTQTEAITGPDTTTVESGKYWKTVTQIAVDDGCAGNISVGIVDELATPIYPLNQYSENPALCHINVTGTINVTMQVTLESPEDSGVSDAEDLDWIATQDTDIVGATADAVGSLDQGAVACRLIVNSYSSGAEVQVRISDNS